MPQKRGVIAGLVNRFLACRLVPLSTFLLYRFSSHHKICALIFVLRPIWLNDMLMAGVRLTAGIYLHGRSLSYLRDYL